MGRRSNNFIFDEDEKGKLQFIGDFDGLYQSDADPWDQSAYESDMSDYYLYSRKKIASYINKNRFNNIVEIGCGIGHSTFQLSQLTKQNFQGADISATAIKKAKVNYPNMCFFQQNICQPNQKAELIKHIKFDCIILNQVLWYVMHAMDDVKKNVLSMLTNNGQVMFSTAFLSEQRYGTEYFNGYYEFVDYLEKNWSKDFSIMYKDYDDSQTYSYNDGLLCMERHSLE